MTAAADEDDDTYVYLPPGSSMRDPMPLPSSLSDPLDRKVGWGGQGCGAVWPRGGVGAFRLELAGPARGCLRHHRPAAAAAASAAYSYSLSLTSLLPLCVHLAD